MNGLEVKSIRQSLGMNQAEFANALNCGRSLICKVETGVRPVTTDLEARIDGLLSVNESGQFDKLAREAIRKMTAEGFHVTKREEDLLRSCVHIIIGNDTRQALGEKQLTTLMQLIKKQPIMHHKILTLEAQIKKNNMRYENLRVSKPQAVTFDRLPGGIPGTDKTKEILEKDGQLLMEAFLLTMQEINIRVIISEIILKANEHETEEFCRWLKCRDNEEKEFYAQAYIILKKYIGRGNNPNGFLLLSDPSNLLWK